MVTSMAVTCMSCRCIQEQWRRDLAKQRDLAKKAAVLENCTYVLFKRPDGKYEFTAEGNQYTGELVEIITQY